MAKLSKLNLWLYHYLNESCSTTFLNQKEAARYAGYKTTNEESLRSIGHQNFTKLADKINKWLDEHGLSENTLKMKLIELMNIHETKFIKVKGAVQDSELVPGTRKIITTGFILDHPENGLQYTDGETLLSIDTAAIETQRKTLDMALKVKGMNAPIETKVENTGEMPKWVIEVHKVNSTDKGDVDEKQNDDED